MDLFTACCMIMLAKLDMRLELLCSDDVVLRSELMMLLWILETTSNSGDQDDVEISTKNLLDSGEEVQVVCHIHVSAFTRLQMQMMKIENEDLCASMADTIDRMLKNLKDEFDNHTSSKNAEIKDITDIKDCISLGIITDDNKEEDQELQEETNKEQAIRSLFFRGTSAAPALMCHSCCLKKTTN